ncbi:hypothetical protein [Plasmodium yoelii yoelii]|uniref:type I protein arginine methyltransferase n=1 Tax=Plasmodium yoelii yoelii TaxID=73239 RepID=Q7RSZ1_PLAYO|nr:hypothetical protein [Plasmodium yoelii yoelii]
MSKKYIHTENKYEEKGKHFNAQNGSQNFSQDALKQFYNSWDKLYKEEIKNEERKNFIKCDEDGTEKDMENGNKEYFNSYAYIHIHEDMIKDEIRTRSYYDAIRKNEHLIKDKIVLDVGCGTGILSFFAAKHGAKHVYSIEKSNIIYTALNIRDANNLTDKITFIKGLAENITLPVEKVDIIISEWMGYCLLYENMLDTVLFCRDKWLKPGGIIFPDKAYMYIAEEVVIDYVDKNYVVTNSSCILKLDLNTCTKEDLSFVSPFTITMTRRDYIHALVIWFDISFSACHTDVSFTTGPYGPNTHWKQIVLYTNHIITGEKNETLKGMFALKKNEQNNRYIDMKLHYNFSGAHSKVESTQFFNIS